MRKKPTASAEAVRSFRTRHTIRRWMTWNHRLAADIVAVLYARPASLLGRGKSLQSKSRTSVARVVSAGRSYLIKFHHWAGFWKTLSKSRTTSPNRFSFELGVELANLGVPTPPPLACVDVRFGPFNICSYLLTEYVEGTTLYRLLRCGQPDIRTLDVLARQVADIWQSLDEQRLSHNDLKPENFMVDLNGRVWLIDLENARRHQDRKSLRHSQGEDLRRFFHARSWQANPTAADLFRQRLKETPALQTALAEAGAEAHPLAQQNASPIKASQRVTVVIPCHGAVDELPGCVEAVSDFADEVLLAVPESNDRAWEAVENRVDCRAWWCERLDRESLLNVITAARHPWVLLINPNERVSPDLAKEIQFLLADNPRHNGYCIERRNLVEGRAMRFGDFAPDTPLRLVRRDSGVVPDLGGRDQRKQQLPAGIGRLRCRIVRDLAPGGDRLSAKGFQTAMLTDKHNNAGGMLDSRLHRLVRGSWRFARAYFIRWGFLDGIAGLRAAALSARFELTPDDCFPKSIQSNDNVGKSLPPGCHTTGSRRAAA